MGVNLLLGRMGPAQITPTHSYHGHDLLCELIGHARLETAYPKLACAKSTSARCHLPSTPQLIKAICRRGS